MASGSGSPKGRVLHLLREVLDHEIVDCDGNSCGMVDDIELEWTVDGPGVAALQLGPGRWGRSRGGSSAGRWCASHGPRCRR
jgi:sporulation protein YlmC with PRC-barrel domain